MQYWTPRVAAALGGAGSSARYDKLAQFGLRHLPNETLLKQWDELVKARLAKLKL